MTLFDEVQELSSESHAKWFERYCNKIDLENAIKIMAAKGKTVATIPVNDKKSDYLKGRLLNPKTIDMLKNRLGDGFSVGLKTEKFESPISKLLDRTEIYIEISW